MGTEGVTEFAPAKINLCLHVTDRQPDGYHLLDSLVVFTSVGDEIHLCNGVGLQLAIDGPEASALDNSGENIVLRAARALGADGVSIRLRKALPVASGIGGGSADAAATLRALRRWTGQSLPASEVLALGADVPVCLAGRPARMQGIGETLSPLPALPPLWLVLVNPRLPVPTARVFEALQNRQNTPLPGLPDNGWTDAQALAGWLKALTRNDLEIPACDVLPKIAEVMAAIDAAPGCLLARMSGSGATCFGLFVREESAQSASHLIRKANPAWWVVCSSIRQDR